MGMSENRPVAAPRVSVPPCWDLLLKREWSSGIVSDTENTLTTILIAFAVPTGNF